MMRFVRKDADKKNLLKSLFYLIVCAICVFAVSYAWFYNNLTGEVDDVEFISFESIGFQISLTEDGTYSNSLSIDFPDNLLLSPVSGDPVYQNDGDYGSLWAPSNWPKGTVASLSNTEYWSNLDWQSVSYDEDAEQNSFYQVKLYFCADNSGYVTFNPSEFLVKPAAEAAYRQKTSYTGESGAVTAAGEVVRPIRSTPLMTLNAGALTKDYIAAASRIKIYSPDTTEGIQQNSLIMPNERYALSWKQSGSLYTFSMNEQGTAVGRDRLMYYDNYQRQILSYSSLSSSYLYTNQDTKRIHLLRLEKDKNEDLYKGWVIVTIWIEGFDNEAHDIFAGGEISCDMKFRYVEDPPEINK